MMLARRKDFVSSYVVPRSPTLRLQAGGCWYKSMEKVLLQLMPNRVDLAEVAEISGGHLPIAKKKNYWKCASLELQGTKTVMQLNR